ncbi:MAG: DUF4375 domain-containing protein [Gemmatimonadetes bacterium]|nr:DUF4375 domain-containing protein [Gemmatimonadota bacterium]
MAVLGTDGVGGEREVDSLTEAGYRLERLDAMRWMWRVELPAPRVLEIWFTGTDRPYLAALSYRTGKPWGSAAERRRAKLQAEFYRRYQALFDPAIERGPGDNVIEVVAEFEADVNNGGFGQYLSNKSTARARQALEALMAIGAKRSHRWLTQAIEAGGDEARMARLDQQFFDRPDDLASLTMKYLPRARGDRPSKRSKRP